MKEGKSNIISKAPSTLWMISLYILSLILKIVNIFGHQLH